MIAIQEEHGDDEANKILKNISGSRKNILKFPEKKVAASNETTEELFNQVSEKLKTSIYNLYKKDNQLFQY